MRNSQIENPGHGLITAIRQMPKLRKRAEIDREFILHLNNILHPFGATTVDFIGL